MKAGMAMQGVDYPALYQVADASSLSGQRWFKRLTAVELILVLAGAASGAVTVVGGTNWRVSAIAAAVSFLGAGAAKLLAYVRGYERDWFNGRAVAETVKSLTWRFVTRTPPFEDDGTAESRLVEHLREAIRMGPLVHHRVGTLPDATAQITETMRTTRRLGWAELRDFYVDGRIRDQGDWYRRRALGHERSRDRWLLLSLGGYGAAVVLAIAGVFSDDIANLNLLGLAAAVAAAATAWSQVGRHEEQSRAYAIAYQELLLMLSLGPAVVDEAGLTRLVTTAESAISREHTLWAAKRTEALPAE